MFQHSRKEEKLKIKIKKNESISPVEGWDLQVEKSLMKAGAVPAFPILMWKVQMLQSITAAFHIMPAPNPALSRCMLSHDLLNPHHSHPRAQMLKKKNKLSQANPAFADRCASSGSRAAPAWSSFPCTQPEPRPNPSAGPLCSPRAVTPAVLSSSLLPY